MAIYVPNVAEKSMLERILADHALILGLYSNSVNADGSITIASITELTTGGGRGYAPIELTADVLESAVAANKWTLSTDGNGKAAGAYSNAVQAWTFNATDVADGATAYGVFGYCRVLAFTSGLQPIKPGDVLRQGAVCAEVVAVNVTSGSWYAGTAAGFIYLKRQVGTFVAGATLVNGSKATATSEIKGLTATPVAAGTGYVVGDRFLIAGAGTGAVGRVTAITAGTGAVTAVELLTGGKDYTVATQATTKIDGAGDNALTVAVASLYTTGPAVAIATIAADSVKRLMFIDPFSVAQPITPAGFQVQYPAALTLASSS